MVEVVFMHKERVTVENEPTIAPLTIDLSLDDLLTQAGPAAAKQVYKETLERNLAIARSSWTPKLIYRWLHCAMESKSTLLLFSPDKRESTYINLGYSIQFVEGAEKVLIGVYTVGQELEELAQSSSEKGSYFDSYIFDQISLKLLDKINSQATDIIEKYASTKGWGVSPFLSPGSVHGWELEDQVNLTALLPIEEIGVEQSPSGILHPFKSISFLIAAGPGLQGTKVGTCCQVCSRRDNCEMQGLA